MGPLKSSSESKGLAERGLQEAQRLVIVAEWVESSCAEQGVPVKVTDAAVLGQVAIILVAGGLPHPESHSPSDFNARRIEASAPSDPRIDSQVVDEACNDRALAIGGKISPLRPEVFGVSDVAL